MNESSANAGAGKGARAPSKPGVPSQLVSGYERCQRRDMELVAEHGSLILALVGAGLFAGIVAGLFGIGGGAVIVPVLFFLFDSLGYADRAMHVAVGTSLATIIATSLRSVAAHNGRGAVDWQILKGWGPFIMVGSAIGIGLSSFISGEELTLLFGAVALLISLQFFFGRPDWRVFSDMTTGLLRAVLGLVMGALSALMGIGGGTFGVTLMTISGRPIHQAIGTAAGFGVAIGIPGALAAMAAGWGRGDLPPGSVGHVNLIAFAAIASLTVLMAPVGARLAHSLDADRLRKLFGILLAVVALRMIWSVIAG
ncbi:MAG: sulfite exporter TauE/SafE family protein [Pseudomonadota bacterium]